MILALHHHHATASNLAATILLIVAIVATILALAGAVLPRLRINWIYAAVVAVIAWVVLLVVFY